MSLPPLGLDVAKLKFNACLIREGGKLRHKVFPNTAACFAQLWDWLKGQGVKRAQACLEATGAYSDSLATCLHEAGHTVSLVNPASIKAYAQGVLSRTKTDRVDAALIAGFCAERRPPAWTTPRAGTARTASACAPAGLTRRDAHDGGELPLVGHPGRGREGFGRGAARPPLRADQED